MVGAQDPRTVVGGFTGGKDTPNKTALWKAYRSSFMIQSDVFQRDIDPHTGYVHKYQMPNGNSIVGDVMPCHHYLRRWKGEDMVKKLSEAEIAKKVRDSHWRALTGASKGTPERVALMRSFKEKSALCRLNKNALVGRVL